MSIQKVQAGQPVQYSRKSGAHAAKAAAAVAAAGGVLYMAKTGRLNPKEGGNKVVETLKSALKKPADFVLKQGSKLKNKVQLASKENPNASAVMDKFSKLSKNAGEKKDAFVANMSKKVDTAKDFIESKFNKSGKFD